jgi:uncharacterized protein (TIGR02001 family)
MSRYLPVSMLTLAIIPVGANAIDISDDLSVTLSVAALSDYRSMGISSSQGNPALQGYAQLSHNKTGLYAGLWSSSYDAGDHFDAYREDAYLIGKHTQINEDIDLDISLGHYEYPEQSSFNLYEIYAISNLYGFQVSFIYDFASNDKNVPNTRGVSAGYNFSLPYETNFLVRYGLTDVNFDFISASGNTRENYADWEAALSKQYLGLTWKVSYVDTNLSRYECENSTGYNNLCSSTIVFGINKSF